MIGATAGATACLRGSARAAPPSSEDSILRIRGLVVIDEQGVDRMVIGAPTPDPKGIGARVAPLYGIVINGPTGEERGGYGVTGRSDEAILTLDATSGDEVFKVVANPDSGASLFVMHHDGATVTLTTYRGDPELHLTDAEGSTIFKQPEAVSPL